MSCSTPGLPVHHQLLEFTQTHVHRVSDAIQPSHPLLSPSPPAPQSLPASVFSNESPLRMRWPKYWSFSFSIIPSEEIPGLIFRMDWLDLLAVRGTLSYNIINMYLLDHFYTVRLIYISDEEMGAGREHGNLTVTQSLMGPRA